MGDYSGAIHGVVQTLADDVAKQTTGVAGGSTTTITSVASSATVVTLLAANTSRVKAIIRNDGTQVLYVREGAGAVITDPIRLAQNDIIIITDTTEIITGIWDSANGSARISETV